MAEETKKKKLKGWHIAAILIGIAVLITGVSLFIVNRKRNILISQIMTYAVDGEVSFSTVAGTVGYTEAGLREFGLGELRMLYTLL